MPWSTRFTLPTVVLSWWGWIQNVFLILFNQVQYGENFPDGKAHFDPVTHKILKPDDWEEKYAPEPAIKKELQRQLKAYERHKERNNTQWKSKSKLGN